MPDSSRTPLVLISGLASRPAADLADAFRALRGTAVVHYNLRQVTEGVVRRRLRFGRRDQLSVLELAHGCVSCTLRQDLLPLLRKLAQRPEIERIAVHLDEAMEPEPVCYAMANVIVGGQTVDEFVRLEGVFTVVDVAQWLHDATGDALLKDRALIAGPEDERTVAQVVLSQTEFADVLVVDGSAPDAWTAARTEAVLDRVAAGIPRISLTGLDARSALATVRPASRRGAPTDPHGPLLRGEPPLRPDCGVTTVLYSARRPFHPQRLHEALDVLLDGVVRTRGRAWVASQPDVALWLESAGGSMGIGHAGPWLAAADGPEWEEVPAERRALASLRWDPRFGDRAQEVVIVAHRTAADEIESALNCALLTDDELAQGEPAWAHYPDPFGTWHQEPCADTEVGSP